nr:MAG TPA: protein of unknown function (DUF1998) [Caudoviricetes sp.]
MTQAGGGTGPLPSVSRNLDTLQKSAYTFLNSCRPLRRTRCTRTLAA